MRRAGGLLSPSCCWLLLQVGLVERHTLAKWPVRLQLLHCAFLAGQIWRCSSENGAPHRRHGLGCPWFLCCCGRLCCCCIAVRGYCACGRRCCWGCWLYPKCAIWLSMMFIALSLPAIARWFSWPLSLFKAYCRTCAGVLVSVRSSLWISVLFIKAMNRSLIRSSSAVPSRHCAPRAFSLQWKISSFSFSFFLHVNRRNLLYVVFLGRVKSSDSSWKSSDADIVLMLEWGKRWWYMRCPSVPMHN